MSLILLTGSASSFAFNVNDCVLAGMKGVASDAAARQIRFACDRKWEEHKKQRLQQLTKEFGESLDVETLEVANNYEEISPGRYTISITNRSTSDTVTFVRLEVSPAPAGPNTPCVREGGQWVPYKLSLKPKASVKLLYSARVPSNCLTLIHARGRAPSWSDVALTSVVKAQDIDPFLASE
ncbi:MAG: hypothetical protein EOP50_03315 [Sphingobacteriales bacterium]|nr:MAG: hypothetical protein EOP50_03315 [Sphingobacteriales bacterium]